MKTVETAELKAQMSRVYSKQAVSKTIICIDNMS